MPSRPRNRRFEVFLLPFLLIFWCATADVYTCMYVEFESAKRIHIRPRRSGRSVEETGFLFHWFACVASLSKRCDVQLFIVRRLLEQWTGHTHKHTQYTVQPHGVQTRKLTYSPKSINKIQFQKKRKMLEKHLTTDIWYAYATQSDGKKIFLACFFPFQIRMVTDTVCTYACVVAGEREQPTTKLVSILVSGAHLQKQKKMKSVRRLFALCARRPTHHTDTISIAEFRRQRQQSSVSPPLASRDHHIRDVHSVEEQFFNCPRCQRVKRPQPFRTKCGQ